MKKLHIIFAKWALILLFLSFIACDTSDMEDSAPRIVSRIEVSPNVNVLAIGDQLKFDAIAYDQDGQPIERLWIDWGSSSGSIASVNTVGMVSALASGATTISASAGGVSGSALLNITALDPETSRVTSLIIEEAEVMLGISRSKTLECQVYDQHGAQISGQEINWQSSDNSVVNIDSAGKLTGVNAGTAIVQASLGKHRTEVTVTVSEHASVATSIEIYPENVVKARGEAAEFTAKVYDQYGSLMEDAHVDWVSNDVCAASIDPYGNATALSAGNAEIEAWVGKVSGKGNIRVTPSSMLFPASISGTWIACSSSSTGYMMTMEINQTAGTNELTAKITDANGIARNAMGTYANNVLSLRWEIMDQGKGVVNFIRGATPVDQFLFEGVLVGGDEPIGVRISRALN